MTEQEWLAGEDTEAMLRFVGSEANARRIRLFLCAMCRALWPHMTHTDSRAAVEVSERYADGVVSVHEIGGAHYEAERPTFDPPSELESCAAQLAFYSCSALQCPAADARWPKAVAHQIERSSLRGGVSLRDIFGNPFRPVAFSPAWRTDTATALAKQIYESRDFSAMPVLADALQDAGCDNEAVLTHCRDPKATHVRGCWALDRVLNRA